MANDVLAVNSDISPSISGELVDVRIQVPADAAEAFIVEKKLGERIKRLRLKRSMGLVELGRHTGLSASFLSQLETGRVVPTLRNLARIAMVFSKDLSYFFEPEARTLFRIHRTSDRIRLPQTGADDPAYFFESLGFMVPDRQMDPYFAEFLPGNKTRRSHQHTGSEFIYVVDGEIEITHGTETHSLVQGDAAYFDASTIHSYGCKGTTAAKVIIVTMQTSHAPAMPPAIRTSGSRAGIQKTGIETALL